MAIIAILLQIISLKNSLRVVSQRNSLRNRGVFFMQLCLLIYPRTRFHPVSSFLRVKNTKRLVNVYSQLTVQYNIRLYGGRYRMFGCALTRLSIQEKSYTIRSFTHWTNNSPSSWTLKSILYLIRHRLFQYKLTQI